MVKSVPTKLSHAELNRNRSFRLYIKEDADQHSDSSDSEEGGIVGDLVTIRKTVHAQWAYASTTELDHVETDGAPTPLQTIPPHFTSCGDLSNPVISINRKHTSRVKKIRRGIKAFLWPSKHQ